MAVSFNLIRSDPDPVAFFVWNPLHMPLFNIPTVQLSRKPDRCRYHVIYTGGEYRRM